MNYVSEKVGKQVTGQQLVAVVAEIKVCLTIGQVRATDKMLNTLKGVLGKVVDDGLKAKLAMIIENKENMNLADAFDLI